MIPFRVWKIINQFFHSPFHFSLLQIEEDVGDVFQDQENMAAILMRKHLESGDLLMVSWNVWIVKKIVNFSTWPFCLINILCAVFDIYEMTMNPFLVQIDLWAVEFSKIHKKRIKQLFTLHKLLNIHSSRKRSTRLMWLQICWNFSLFFFDYRVSHLGQWFLLIFFCLLLVWWIVANGQ